MSIDLARSKTEDELRTHVVYNAKSSVTPVRDAYQEFLVFALHATRHMRQVDSIKRGPQLSARTVTCLHQSHCQSSPSVFTTRSGATIKLPAWPFGTLIAHKQLGLKRAKVGAYERRRQRAKTAWCQRTRSHHLTGGSSVLCSI